MREIQKVKKILYLGLDPHRYSHTGELHHYPVISIRPLPSLSAAFQEAFKNFFDYTHIIFTSRSTVRVFLSHLKDLEISLDALRNKQLFSIGKATSQALEERGLFSQKIAMHESSEGIVDLLKNEDMSHAYIFYPRSSIARPVIENYLKTTGIKHSICAIYETLPYQTLPIPNVEEYDELVFTSPSTIDAFIKIFGKLPLHKTMTPIGPVTANYLESQLTLAKHEFSTNP